MKPISYTYTIISNSALELMAFMKPMAEIVVDTT